MKTTARFLMMLGAGIVAATSIGVPASAAGRTEPAPSAAQVQTRDRDDDDIVGYYDTRRQCDRAGRIGEWRDRWDDYDCNRVRWGWHRGDWALEVERDWDNDHDDNDDHGGGHGHGHGGGDR